MREQCIDITLRYDMAIGSVNLNEIVYRLNTLKDSLMLCILEQMLRNYDDLISERLSRPMSNPPSKSRKGLGRHLRRNDPKGRFCHGRRIRKRGFRNQQRTISTIFGKLQLPLRVAECCTCGARYSPLLSALGLTPVDYKIISAVF